MRLIVTGSMQPRLISADFEPPPKPSQDRHRMSADFGIDEQPDQWPMSTLRPPPRHAHAQRAPITIEKKPDVV
jgi:hypothetical protein